VAGLCLWHTFNRLVCVVALIYESQGEPIFQRLRTCYRQNYTQRMKF